MIRIFVKKQNTCVKTFSTSMTNTNMKRNFVTATILRCESVQFVKTVTSLAHYLSFSHCYMPHCYNTALENWTGC